MTEQVEYDPGKPVGYDAARAISPATLYEAGLRFDAVSLLPIEIKPVNPVSLICGPALPVATSACDNLWIHRAVAWAEPGDVLVISTGGFFEAGYWGEVLSTAAQARHLGGIVIDGCVRDGLTIAAMGLPVFARGLCMRGTTKDERRPGSVGSAVVIGEARIDRGDLVAADLDGVVVVARDRVADVVAASHDRERFEAEAMSQLAAGSTTLSIYGLSAGNRPW